MKAIVKIALVVVVVSLASGCATLADLLTETVDWAADATEWRGQNGLQVTVKLPRGGTAHPVWGTAVYTDDSSIGTAAVHAGLIDFETGGTVTIEIRAGQDSYRGSTSNGVTTEDYGSFAGSFVFVPDEE